MRKIHDLAQQFTRKEAENKLRQALQSMDVPSGRTTYFSQHNFRWLQRNLAINNADHPKLNEALALVKFLIKDETV